MSEFNIQREAIIEIVGTQYDGREKNHAHLQLNQKLLMQHQKNNPHDKNAVLILTEDGLALGYIPKGQASLYAPAIDSNKYHFVVEIVKTEPDQQRPILIIKILAELKNVSEEAIEKNIVSFVQNIINGDAVQQKEYLHFIDAETVSIEELCSVLNRARLIHKLYLLSSDVMKAYHIQADGSKFKPFTKDSLLCYLQEMQLNISEILNQIQKKYNTLLDIDDEKEYQKIQSETREKRKKFRLLNQLCQEYYQAVENYVPVTAAVPENIPEPVKAEPVPKKSELTEEAFLNWLLNSQSVSEKTAKNTIAYLREAEKVYYRLFGAEEKIFGVSSKEKAEEIFTKFMNYDTFQEINSKKNYDFSSAFNKFMQFAGINKKSKDLIDSKKK